MMPYYKTLLPRLFLAAFLTSPQLCHSSDFFQMFTDISIWESAVKNDIYLNHMTIEMIQDEEMLDPPTITYQHNSLSKLTDYYTPERAFDGFYGLIPPLEFDSILDDQLVETDTVNTFRQDTISTLPSKPRIKLRMAEHFQDATNETPIQRRTFNNHRAPKLASPEKDRIIMAILNQIPTPPKGTDKKGWEDLAIATKPLWNSDNSLTFIAFRDFLSNYKSPLSFSENQKLILYNLKKGADRVHYKRKQQR